MNITPFIEETVYKNNEHYLNMNNCDMEYKTIFEDIVEGYYEIDLTGRFIFFNKSVCKILDLSKSELLGLSYKNFTDAATTKKLFRTFSKVYKTKKPAKRQEFSVVRSDGTRRYLEISCSLIGDGKGSANGFRGIARDISERRLTEQALIESKEQYEKLYETSIVPLFQTSIVDGKPIKVNTAAAKLLGYDSPGALIADKISINDFFNPASRNELMATLIEFGEINNFETKLILKNDRKQDVSISAKFYLEKGYVEEAVLDISERKKAERERKELQFQLQHAQKMEAIGTLAGGIAHDFNNLLMAIQGNVSLLKLDITPDDQNYELLENLEQSVKSGADLTSQILGYARKGKYTVEAVEFNNLIEDAVQSFKRIRKDITLTLELGESVPNIRADRGQVEQILLNLFVNSADAMPKGGQIKFETKNVDHSEIKSKLYRPEKGKYVNLTVTDTGSGIEEKIRTKVFDPFFTTKKMGRGTGLGLASVYGIVKNHNGYIEVESEENRGTSFNIYFPATKEQSSEKQDKIECIEEGHSSILLVDDEEIIIEIGAKVLEKIGYKVTTASSGAEAVNLINKNKGQYDLVILDMIMPGMSGEETFSKIQEIDKDVRVLLSSGYSCAGPAKEIISRGCSGFLQKPYNVKNLSSKLKEILNDE